eukprot:gnl/MRDRNA2_/MRDRNA2_33196_c0_seq1.p1 gnl/MRDRNA2_/MRDRNA2_33196_c0~~gnl/MRDRNA2_/MRDRNA2_33196_c0_seq1.p1  ORF type:complete len:197 (-),score=44.26 gnl/MRDRNA2_/MRDRNA2_33196_c0_seq1:128-718(-)
MHRLKVLQEHGGISLKSSVLSLKACDELRWFSAVFGRKGGNLLKASLDILMLAPGSKASSEIISNMHKNYTSTGIWEDHALNAVEEVLRRQRGGTAILSHDKEFFQTSKTHWPVKQLMHRSGEVNWSQSCFLNLDDGDATNVVDPRQLCGPASDSKSSEFCRAMEAATDLAELFKIIDEVELLTHDAGDVKKQDEL